MDYLRGLKENVIMGRLIPAGTGMEYYRHVKIAGEDVVEEELMTDSELALAEGIPGLRRGCSRAVRGRSQRRHSGRTGRVRLQFRLEMKGPGLRLRAFFALDRSIV